MKKLLPRLWPACFAAGLLALLPSGWARRISEPDTVFYGRIVQRAGGREFLITSGELAVKLKTSGPGGREHRFTAPVQSLAAGRYSYRLRIPHQLLAYDLSVAPGVVALPSVGAGLEQLAMELDGQPLEINPLAIESLKLSPQNRASAHRLDLQLGGEVRDSDEDGQPDWWEDANGLDKWNPNDAEAPGDSDSPPASVAEHAGTFAEWRALLFPQDSRGLELFGQEDPDGDGIPNLFEYAFALDPHRADADSAMALPHMTVNSRGPGIAFRQRTAARDLQYRLEASSNLILWVDDSGETERSGLDAGGQTHFQTKSSGENPAMRFFRIRVIRAPIP